jgi:glycosyltransferase involved in cell wall biosynthesis
LKEIIVDARCLSETKPAGVARYTLSIVEELLNKKIRVRLISNKKIIILPNKKFIKYYMIDEFLKFRYIPGTLFIIFIIPFIRKFKGKVFWGCNHAVPLWNSKTILTIHDLVAFDFPSSMTLINLISTAFSTIISIFSASTLTTVSNFTKVKLYKKFNLILNDTNIEVISNSVNSKVFYINKNQTSKYLNNNIDRYILAVGSLEPRKNLFNLIDAFIEIKEFGYDGHLLLAGGREWKSGLLHKKISTSNFNEFIHLLGYVPDKDLNILYNNCSLFVFPSLYEGFGIPALEAIAAGSNILCSTNTEIYFLFNRSSKITWFNPYQDNLSFKIKEALKNKKRESIYGLPTWHTAALKLIKIASTIEKK